MKTHQAPTTGRSGTWSPSEILLFGTVAILLGAGLVNLAAAHVASLVTGHGRFPGGLGDAAIAVVHTADAPKEPARAWPTPAQQAALPGPVGYYLCLTLVVVIVAVIATGTIVTVSRWRTGRLPLGIRPNQGLARRGGIRRLIVARSQPGRLTLGTVDGALVAAEAQASLAVIGPTGCGKTAGFAIPALLEWDGPVICTSVKSDLVMHTLARRRQLGRVWVFDPTGSVVPERGAWWSPLTRCGTWGEASRMSAWLCDAAQSKIETVTNGDLWHTLSRKALGPHLLAAAVDGRTMRDVVRWIDRQEQDEIREILCRHAGVSAELEARLAGPEGEMQRAAMEPRVRREVTDGIRQVLAADPTRRGQLADLAVSHWPIEMQDQLDERVWDEVERRVRARLQALAADEATRRGELDALVAVEALWAHEDRLRGSVYASLQTYLYAYADPLLADILAGEAIPPPEPKLPADPASPMSPSPEPGTTTAVPTTHQRPAAGDPSDGDLIDFDVWLDGPNTIFVVAPSSEQHMLRPVFTLLVGQAIRHGFTVANRNQGRLPHPCLVLIDEAANVAPLPALPEYAATARSHGITLVSVWQDLAQIKDLYGERWHTVLNNHRAKWFGTGIGDDTTLDYISRMIGDSPFLERNFSADVTGLGVTGRRSISEHTTYRRAAPIDVLRRLDEGDGILLYGSELPAKVRLRPWFTDRGLSKLAEGAKPD